MEVRNLVRIGLAALAVIAFSRATCGKPKSAAGIEPVQAMKIKDNVYFHNVGITYGEGRYYTLNGGNDQYGVVNVYDKKGRLVESHAVELDGRAIFYYEEDEVLYVKPFGLDLYTVDPEDGDADVELEEVFEEDNSSVAFSPDGEYVYELADGTVRVLSTLFGDEENSFELEQYSEERGYDAALAASDKYLFTWTGGGKVWVHDLEGNYVDSFRLPRDGFGLSLSWANGMLWIAEDAAGIEYDEEGAVVGGAAADGYWYGYKLVGLK